MTYPQGGPGYGESGFGSPGNPTTGAVVHAFSGGLNIPGAIAFHTIASNGTETVRYVWITTGGKLVIGSTYPPTDQDSSGTVIGTQT